MKNGQHTRFLTFSPLPEWKSSLLPFRLSSWLLCLSPLSFPPAPLGFNWILMVALLLSVAWPILIYIPLPLLMFRPSCRLTADAEHRQLWLKGRGQSNSVSRSGTAGQSPKTNQVNGSFGIHLYGGQINLCSLSSTTYSKCYTLCKHSRKKIYFSLVVALYTFSLILSSKLKRLPFQQKLLQWLKYMWNSGVDFTMESRIFHKWKTKICPSRHLSFWFNITFVASTHAIS